MKVHFKIAALLSLFFCSLSAHAWTINSDFESGNVGDKALGAGAFNEAFKYTVLSKEFINQNGSTQSAKVGIDAGTDGWADWGGAYTFPSNIPEGGEIWFRAYIYYPANFDFTATGQGLKTLRIHVKNNATGIGEGMFDALTTKSGLSVGSEVASVAYYANNPRSKWANQGVPVAKGEWHAIEMYVKYIAAPNSGIFRVWQDGKLIFEDTLTYTMKTKDSVSDFIYFYTYWNGNAPKTQSCYIDDVVITSDTPNNVDAKGNRYIGLKYIAPKPATVIVQ